MAPDAPSGAAPRDHLPGVRGAGPAGGRRRRHARGRRTRRDRAARASRRKGIVALLRRCGACTCVDPLPYAVGKYRSRAYRRRLQRAARRRRRSTSSSATSCFPPSTCRSTLPCPGRDLHAQRRVGDLAAPRRRRRPAPSAGCSTARSTGGCCATKRRTLARFDGVLAVSDADRRDVRAPLSGRHPRAGSHRADRRRHRLLHAVGAPARAPTARSSSPGRWTGCRTKTRCAYFCRDVLPLIRAEEPDVRLSIVGRAPTPAVRQPRRRSRRQRHRPRGRCAAVHGRAAVYVVPLRIGGGTRLKIFEAMAMGKAVVSTTVGAEGLPVVERRAPDARRRAATFARAVVRLLRDAATGASGSERPRAPSSLERYDWSAVAGALEEPLDTDRRRTRLEAIASHVPHVPSAAPVEAGASGQVS